MIINTIETWETILSEIKNKIPHESYITWFDNTTLIESCSESLTIGVPNKFVKTFLIEKFFSIIEDSVYNKLNSKPEILFKIVPELRNKVESAKLKGVNLISGDAAQDSSINESIESQKYIPVTKSGINYKGLPLSSSFNLENFVVGPSNQMAYSGAKSIIENQGVYNPLFLYGSSGLGKTHLLHGICYSLLAKRPDAHIVFISCEEFINDYISHVRTRNMESFRNKYRKIDTLIIDDIHFLGQGNKDQTQDEFFHTFDALYNSSCQIIVSSDAHPKDIFYLKEKIQMRFISGLVASIEPPSFSTRVKILKLKCKEREYTFPHEILEFIASKITSNVRELEGTMVKIHALAKFNNKKITLELAHKALHVTQQRSLNYRTDPKDVLTKAADFFNLTNTEIKLPKRGKNAIPRKLTMLAMRKLFAFSYQEISKTFGSKSHASIVFGENSAIDMLDKDPKINILNNKLIEFLKEHT